MLFCRFIILAKFRQIFTKAAEGTSPVNFKILLQGFVVLELIKDRGARILQYKEKYILVHLLSCQIGFNHF